MTDPMERARGATEWFREAKLGVFVHWGAYSVPAWAEPIGELGTIDMEEWFPHNPYAEWYANTIRFEDSPAARHHRETYGDLPYEDFLDRWRAERFDPDDLVELFAAAGAGYVVPTTKHHDGIALWDAPGTRLSTVGRGPGRDLIGGFERAARARGLRFGVYYSGGIDWGFRPQPRIEAATQEVRLEDATYAAYAYAHVVDLIDRYRPDLLWNDISWPEAGRDGDEGTLTQLFAHYYATVPDGLVNDRWNVEHADFRTSEYEAFRDVEGAGLWEHTRGLGYSFGYNALEDERQTMTGPELVGLLVDTTSRGGNLLINVGPTASGELPPLQRAALDYVAEWRRTNGAAVWGARPFPEAAGRPRADGGLAAWSRDDRHAYLVLDGPDSVTAIDPALVDVTSAGTLAGSPVIVEEGASGSHLRLDADALLPLAVRFDLRRAEADA